MQCFMRRDRGDSILLLCVSITVFSKMSILYSVPWTNTIIIHHQFFLISSCPRQQFHMLYYLLQRLCSQRSLHPLLLLSMCNFSNSFLFLRWLKNNNKNLRYSWEIAKHRNTCGNDETFGAFRSFSQFITNVHIQYRWSTLCNQQVHIQYQFHDRLDLLF